MCIQFSLREVPVILAVYFWWNQLNQRAPTSLFLKNLKKNIWKNISTSKGLKGGGLGRLHGSATDYYVICDHLVTRIAASTSHNNTDRRIDEYSRCSGEECEELFSLTSGGSRISPRRGRQLPGGGGANLWFCQFLPKTAWKWRNFGPPGGGGGARPLRPPLRSATADCATLSDIWILYSLLESGWEKPEPIHLSPTTLEKFYTNLHQIQQRSADCNMRSSNSAIMSTEHSFHLHRFLKNETIAISSGSKGGGVAQGRVHLGQFSLISCSFLGEICPNNRLAPRPLL